MIRFNVNGEYLDLPADFGLQFKKSNILFAFDNIECERSTSFDIPATPQNNRIFALAKWVQTDGVGMRRKYESQMQDGVVVQDGYLHIDAFNQGRYKAVFVTGELLGLKQIRDAGKIKEYWKPAGGIVWSVANIKDANTYDGQVSVAITRYLSNVQLLHPSVDLGDMANYAYSQLTGKIFPPYTRGYRLIPREVESMERADCVLTFAGTNAETKPSPSQADYGNTLSITQTLSAVDVIEQILAVRINALQYIKIREWRAKQTLILTFPNNFPANYFLMSIRDTGAADNPEDTPYSDTWFLGDYKFYPNGTTSGTQLAGRSVTIPTGTPFLLVNRDWYEYQPAPLNINGFWELSEGDYSFTIQIEGGELQAGDTVRAYDLLPDLTLTDLLKMYCGLTGKMLYYNENGDIEFDDLNVGNWSVYDLTGKVIKADNVSRKFGDYAQRNVIEFKSGADVMPTHRVSEAYTIDNDNIEERKTLLSIPYSEGELAEADGFIVARFDAEDMEQNTLYADGIMTAFANGSRPRYGERISIPKNAGLQALCDASTSVQVQARMTYLEFTQIKPKTLLFYNGVRYVWTEAQWSKGVASFKLSKIPA